VKIIFSRKGFDSSSGGCPNPVLPDGRLLPMPIPDQRSPIQYNDINCSGINLGEIVSDITRDKVKANAGAHLDPDIDHSQYSRSPGWQPLLGQHGSAQGHLAKQGVGAGDLFLFFGLFQPVIETSDGWRFNKQQPARHCFWGWLQVDECFSLNSLKNNQLDWARYHPHFHLPVEKNNSLYIARQQLHLGGNYQDLPGSGQFKQATTALQLTAPEARTPSLWRIPSWLYPEGDKPPLSYHHKPERWQKPAPGKRFTCLQSVARGQEFVLDTRDYPQAKRWAQQLIIKNS
jgi:putative DNA base modification enzyme with NMAD domain